MVIQRAARDFIRIFVTVIGLRLENHLDSFTQNLFAGSHKCQLITKTRARDFPNRFLCRQQKRRLRRDWNNIKVLNVLGPRIWRWALFLLLANGGMFLSQRLLLPASQHLELPGREPRNAWLLAFTWIQQNTPVNAHFALDPEYLARPGEDYHSFRALAERSQLADGIKDAAVVTQVPELASRWAEQVNAQAGWRQFQFAAFERLKARFGVDWVLVSDPPPARLTCVWHNHLLAVCRIPDRASAPSP